MLAVAVPTAFWNAFFVSGHGIWTSIENAVVGPFIALISFVCSIGNVPLAAALWQGGISFGGVVSFIFADLIALPLILIYRKFYGTRLALQMLAVFWILMAVAGLATELIFTAAGLVPASRPVQVAPDRLTLELHDRAQHRLPADPRRPLLAVPHEGPGRRAARYAIDPVCGMQVAKAAAPASLAAAGASYWFCSDRCRDRFDG